MKRRTSIYNKAVFEAFNEYIGQYTKSVQKKLNKDEDYFKHVVEAVISQAGKSAAQAAQSKVKKTLPEANEFKFWPDAIWVPNSDAELQAFIRSFYNLYKDAGSTQLSLNWIDTSKITKLSHTFEGMDINVDVSGWDLSSCKLLEKTFAYFKGQADVSGWDVSGVRSFIGTFEFASNIPDISSWDLRSALTTHLMFAGAEVNVDLSDISLSHVKDVCQMFKYAKISSAIPAWDLSGVVQAAEMFANAEFLNKQDISKITIAPTAGVADFLTGSNYDGELPGLTPKQKDIIRW